MSIITYDFEVFSHDWIVVFKDKETETYTVVHNDNEALRECMYEENIYVGFNSKHYDQYILKAIAGGDFTPEQVKQLNDFLIDDGQGWNYNGLKDVYYDFNNVDIKDDMQAGLSLKAIEGNLGLNIQETEVDFNLDRPLTKEELERTIHYCKCDVDCTETLIDIRESYLKNKIHIGKLAGLSDKKALSMTNAKLTSAMLKAEKKPHNDEREYKYPDNLLKEYIPQEVFNFFDKMKDESISDSEVFSAKLKINIGDCPVVIGYGGIHGAIPNYFFEEDDERTIVNEDVGSYYPHLMTICGYTSRNIPSPKVFEEVLETRMQAKASGDKATANALKLVVNTTYGAMLNAYNDLYDPLMGRSVCVTGQLFLLELGEHLYRKIPDLKIVQLNTDGIMVECNKSDLNKVNSICDEWQKRTGFTLEEDKIKKIAQKDVNNYFEIQQDGKEKAKGGYLVRGISTVGAFNINNNCNIVATALKNYFGKGIPLEQTINECKDILQFQIIAKAGTMYNRCFHLVNGEEIPVQKINRVYATTDERYGKVYKVKGEQVAMIASLPEHCLIDNDNHLSIEDIDKQFYIDMANDKLKDFQGKRRKKKMAASTKTQTLNIYQKLLKAREMFLAGDVKKSGKNMYMAFKYFELEDIVPTATKIFAEVGIIPIVNFTSETATMTIVNTENTEENITFSAPFNQLEPITSNSGKQATNSMQALGSSITYMRRYLYMIALDICENDEIDANLGAEDKPKKAPATPEKREETKKKLTSPADNATELQIKGLKKVLKELKEKHPDKEEFIQQIAVKSNGFTDISKADCEKIIEKVTTILKEGE